MKGQEAFHPISEGDRASRPWRGLDQVVHRPGRDTLNISLLDNRRQRLLGEPPRLQKAREIRALAQLRNAQLDRPGARFPHPIAVPVALRQTIRALLAQGSARPAADIELPRRAAAPPRPTAKQPGSGDPGGSRAAANPSISRNRSASDVFSNRPCRAIISLVISGRSGSGWWAQPDPTGEPLVATLSYTTSRDVTPAPAERRR
jgi:hypothetical protein